MFGVGRSSSSLGFLRPVWVCGGRVFAQTVMDLTTSVSSLGMERYRVTCILRNGTLQRGRPECAACIISVSAVK